MPPAKVRTTIYMSGTAAMGHTFVGRLCRAVDFDIEIAKVLFVRNSTDSRDTINFKD